MFAALAKSIFGSANDRYVRGLGKYVTAINGFEMNDPQKMLEAYGKLMRSDRISASVVRNGKPMTIDFNIK